MSVDIALRSVGSAMMYHVAEADALAEKHIGSTESPIERMLRVGLCWGVLIDPEWAFVDHEGNVILGRAWGTSRQFLIYHQKKIGRFRADFVVRILRPEKQLDRLLAVECDGFDFHDRTPALAERDKARDRSFLAAGVTTIRFTGSEIYRDAARCAIEVRRCARSIADGGST